jgi:hypothetical protein
MVKQKPQGAVPCVNHGIAPCLSYPGFKRRTSARRYPGGENGVIPLSLRKKRRQAR